MPKGVYERKPKDQSMPETEPQATVSEKMFPVILVKNYVPQGAFEIVGYLKEAVKVKNAIGQMVIVEPEEFIKGEMKPHESPGVGFGPMTMKDGREVNAKIWAGTHIKVPLAEAKYVVSKKIAERADDIAA